MSEFTPWLGLCHIHAQAGDNPDTQPTLAAVWADSVKSFEREMHVYTDNHGQQMIWAEAVMPADEWQAKHTNRKDAQSLAGKVSAKHLVEIGGIGAGVTGTGADGTPDGEDEGYLLIEEIEGVEPLGRQFGMHPPKTVPDALYEPLFGQPDPTAAEVGQYGGADKVPPLNTYAILDAAKVMGFVEMLEASGLEYRCLFKGKAEQEIRDVAPYVVRLENGSDFTRNLFSHDPKRKVPWFMWDKEPGIYIRSRGSLEDMWKHFRKFTKVQDEDRKWFYFRFWEGDFLYALRLLDGEQSRFVAMTFAKPVHSICLHVSSEGGWRQMLLSDPDFQFDKTPTISEPIKALFDAVALSKQKRTEIAAFRHRIENARPEVSVNEERLSVLRDWLVSCGFRETAHLAEVIFVLETRYQNPEGLLPQSLLRMLTNKGKGPAARLWLLQNKEYKG